MKTRILVVAPYPIKNPMHGGQKRTKALVARYRQLGNSVNFVAVYQKASYGEAYSTDITIENSLIDNQLLHHPELTDILTGSALTEDQDVKSLFISILKTHTPQIIHVEQPYMIEAVSTILHEINMKSILVFGSQNVEAEMKQSIYRSQLSKRDLEVLVTRTKDIEREAVERSDVVLAVSRHDLGTLTRGFKFKAGYVIPNGIEPLSKHPPKTNEWSALKADKKIDRFATFIGSAHPPNYLGFTKLVANARINPKTQIAIAGGVSSLVIQAYEATEDIWKRVMTFGVLPNRSLNALIYESDILLLPILNGGGSNVKTAEAIVSGKKIVATTYAFRGYEKYLTLPNIYIANSPKAFERALNKAIEASYIALTLKQKQLAQTVTWPHALMKLKRVLAYSYFLRMFRLFRL